MEHGFESFVQWAFQGILGVVAIYGVKVLADLNHSIQELNIKVAVIIQRTEWLEKGLEHHDDRLSKLETTK
jgi:hypothetical protein